MTKHIKYGIVLTKDLDWWFDKHGKPAYPGINWAIAVKTEEDGVDLLNENPILSAAFVIDENTGSLDIIIREKLLTVNN